MRHKFPGRRRRRRRGQHAAICTAERNRCVAAAAPPRHTVDFLGINSCGVVGIPLSSTPVHPATVAVPRSAGAATPRRCCPSVRNRRLLHSILSRGTGAQILRVPPSPLQASLANACRSRGRHLEEKNRLRRRNKLALSQLSPLSSTLLSALIRLPSGGPDGAYRGIETIRRRHNRRRLQQQRQRYSQASRGGGRGWVRGRSQRR